MELTITKDKQDLAQLESVIQKNIGAFYEVGRALMEIRDRELYKVKNGGDYQTFEAYCKGVWDMARTYAFYMIESARVMDNVHHGEQNTPAPTNERQARALSSLPSEQQAPVWKQAVDTAPEGKVTAAHVCKIVKGMTEPAQKPNLNEPVAKQELVSKEFQAAYDQMVDELKNARAMKWQATSHKAAIDMIQILLTISQQMGR